MNRLPRPLARQVGLIVLMFGAAIALGVTLGWLLSLRIPRQTGQAVQATSAQSTAVASPSAPPGSTPLPAATAPPATEVAAAPTTIPSAASLFGPTTEFTVGPASAPGSVPTAASPFGPTTAFTEGSASAPGSVPAASPTIAPTAAAPPTPATGSVDQNAQALLSQVAAAEAALRSGQLEALLDYGQGDRALADVSFDFGDTQHPPSLRLKTTYQGSTRSQAIEKIAIGEQSWERQGDQAWIAGAPPRGLWDQVQFFLPHAASASDPQLTGSDTLRWYDAATDSDVTLVLDPATGTPRELQRRTRRTGLQLTITYRGWNTAVDIRPPAGA
ncbi:MAG TPA: hypothetical protein VFZ66_04725 [Herpetosiphonaceae bacterium]